MSAPYERMADAVLRVLVAEGFEGVSVRKVAALAELSIGAVQHHFPTKDAMLAAAMDRASGRFLARLSERLAAEMSAAARLEALAVALVCPEPGDRDISVAWLLRLARAAVDERTALAHRQDWIRMSRWLADLIAEAAPGVEAESAAVELLALLDGLACAVAVEPDRVSPELAERIARGHVQRLLN
ncbi:TetR/AcrR family transcriptional regulator [Mycolicibacterium nivoides]|uniref:TetR/AcrR family transcriptional regulator n=1 Tax=Mycolicibacterium nivoides TaxID=2487344 RepID=UPI0008AB34F7|nr:TetR/AcrR family transcriptional regulator [Mycolicibacterium nivoides]SER29617.1 DNA-binding transcriptional regulator YbjK [Mycobacterium sp. 88mf]SFG18252.1 DNA-binding transcriptional regulator YbjK [Mycobacterium sp. 455mf]